MQLGLAQLGSAWLSLGDAELAGWLDAELGLFDIGAAAPLAKRSHRVACKLTNANQRSSVA